MIKSFVIFWLLLAGIAAYALQDSLAIPPNDSSVVEQPIESVNSDSLGTSEKQRETAMDRFLNWLFSMAPRGFFAFLTFLLTLVSILLGWRIAKLRKKGELSGEDDYKDEKFERRAKTVREAYEDLLQEELGHVRILGSPEIDSVPVHLLDTFVALDFSENHRTELRFNPEKQAAASGEELPGDPVSVIRRAFSHYRMLLIIGDPGSGKTTLIKFYAMTCQKEGSEKLGLPKKTLPLFLPLREADPGIPLWENLENWAKRKTFTNADNAVFKNWLEKSPTLVLLDGLDEIGDLEKRREICEWIDNSAKVLQKARFVVTSRWTGYRKLDGIELSFEHLRADVLDFSREKQAEFLRKWFRAVYLKALAPAGSSERTWQERQEKAGEQRANEIIAFLHKKENKSMQDLAVVPLLLQIIAILLKERDLLLHNRSELFEASLKYLLDFRDRRRKLLPLLPVGDAISVLAPSALWMQETLQRDIAPKDELHAVMQPILDTLNKVYSATAFCDNLQDRAGLIYRYGDDRYIFRHKSFREYLAAQQLGDEKQDDARIDQLVHHFGEDWWEEPLRFFMNRCDADTFDRFMQTFFLHEKSKSLSAKELALLRLLIREARQRKTDTLFRKLNDGRVSEQRKKYILDCLKAIGNDAVLKQIEEYLQTNREQSAATAFAREILQENEIVFDDDSGLNARLAEEQPDSFLNPHEYNAEYIRIPGGTFSYSLTEKPETVPDIYFAKYPLTNKRYRRFIRYLSGEENELTALLPLKDYYELLRAFAQTVGGNPGISFPKYLADTPKKEWDGLFRSTYDEEKRFRGEDQPVVRISWYAARSYCFWLSLLSQAAKGSVDPAAAANIYRLPTEIEWEWAAAGRAADGGLREYPWGNEAPDEQRANYKGNIGATTPVGDYKAGATPEGLFDMAGNVWEWTESWSSSSNKYRSLRGGGWYNDGGNLRCSARSVDRPVYRFDDVGFRVVRCPS